MIKRLSMVMLALLCVSQLLGACSSDNEEGLGLRLTVELEQVRVDRLRLAVSADGADPLPERLYPDSPRELQSGTQLELRLPSDWDGERAKVAVEGFHQAKVVAQGIGTVTLSASRTAELTIRLCSGRCQVDRDASVADGGRSEDAGPGKDTGPKDTEDAGPAKDSVIPPDQKILATDTSVDQAAPECKASEIECLSAETIRHCNSGKWITSQCSTVCTNDGFEYSVTCGSQGSNPDACLCDDYAKFGEICGGPKLCSPELLCGQFDGGAKGFCSHYCTPTGASCPSGPPGTATLCSIEVGSKWVCAFVCSGFPCPTGMTCDENIGFCKP